MSKWLKMLSLTLQRNRNMKYMDAEKLYKQVDSLMARYAEYEKEFEVDDEELSIFYQGKRKMCSELLGIIDSLQQEQPMPNSTQLIAEWEKEKAVLEQKDFRGDAERMAYNAFLDGFVKGLGYEGTK